MLVRQIGQGSPTRNLAAHGVQTHACTMSPWRKPAERSAERQMTPASRSKIDGGVAADKQMMPTSRSKIDGDRQTVRP